MGKDMHTALRELHFTQMFPLLEDNLHFFSFTKTINYQLELVGKNMAFQKELSSLNRNLSRALSFRKEASIQKFLNMHSPSARRPFHSTRPSPALVGLLSALLSSDFPDAQASSRPAHSPARLLPLVRCRHPPPLWGPWNVWCRMSPVETNPQTPRPRLSCRLGGLRVLLYFVHSHNVSLFLHL